MKIDDIKRILAIGAGTMGHQIGFLCALYGYEVVIYDIDKKMFEHAKRRINELADKFIEQGRLKKEIRNQVIERISFSDNASQAANEVDLITESVPEDPKLKAKIFKMFNDLCPDRTIFTTNTSMLIPSMFAEATGRPEKFLAFHFHDIAVTDVVDIMPHPGTAKETVEIVDAFAKKLGQIVIMLNKENFGYVFNAMLSDVIRSALTLASNNVATITNIDRAWMGIMHTQAGPFGIMDSIGIDTVWKVNDYMANISKDPQLRANADFMKRYLDEGKLGSKSGEGFYSYPDPAFQKTGFISGE